MNTNSTESKCVFPNTTGVCVARARRRRCAMLLRRFMGCNESLSGKQ